MIIKEFHNPTIAILAYHKIGDPPENGWPTWNYISAEIFGKHLEYLSHNNWEVLGIDTFLKGLNEPETFPEKVALITFDDGYLSNLKIALPILNKFNYPATVFVPTDFVGGYNAFDADIFYEPKEIICTWEEFRELEQQRVSVQSHGVFHKHFSALSIDELRTEMEKSKAAIENKLGKRVEVFSFPYGDNGLNPDQTDILLSETGYRSACLYGGKPFNTTAMIAQPYRLARVPIGPDTDLGVELAI